MCLPTLSGPLDTYHGQLEEHCWTPFFSSQPHLFGSKHYCVRHWFHSASRAPPRAAPPRAGHRHNITSLQNTRCMSSDIVLTVTDNQPTRDKGYDQSLASAVTCQRLKMVISEQPSVLSLPVYVLSRKLNTLIRMSITFKLIIHCAIVIPTLQRTEFSDTIKFPTVQFTKVDATANPPDRLGMNVHSLPKKKQVPSSSLAWLHL